MTMVQEQAAQVIRDILQRHSMRVEQILLFGSRARGDARPDSDWDFYVLVDGELAFPQKQLLLAEIQRELARLRIPNDVVLASAERFRRLKDYPGHLGYTVAREGVPIP